MYNPILHSTIKGEGKPLLILHGYFGMSDNWKTLGNLFSKDYQVHLIDQRNHGRSFHADAFNYELLAQDGIKSSLTLSNKIKDSKKFSLKMPFGQFSL